MKKSWKYLLFSFFLLMFASSCGTLTRTQRMERDMFDPKRKKLKTAQQNKLTPEQAAEVKASGGFNPYYVSPKKMKVKMPKKPRHLR